MCLCSSGGVVLAAEDGKIVLENTLDARLDVIFRQKLPEACSLSHTFLTFISISNLIFTLIVSEKKKLIIVD
jgi:hypothetical protein